MEVQFNPLIQDGGDYFSGRDHISLAGDFTHLPKIGRHIPTFRKKKFFVGSGVVEAGCCSHVGQRCKQSGMFWSTSGAENVLSFRCIAASRRLDDFWKYR